MLLNSLSTAITRAIDARANVIYMPRADAAAMLSVCDAAKALAAVNFADMGEKDVRHVVQCFQAIVQANLVIEEITKELNAS